MRDEIKELTLKLGPYSTIVDDNYGGYIAKDASGKELYHIYSDGVISYKIDNNQDIVLYKNGEYIIPNENNSGKYTFDKDGNIICTDARNNVVIYNHSGSISNNGEVEFHFPDKFSFEQTQDEEVVEEKAEFHDYYSGNGHIQYDAEAYETLIQLLTNMVEENTANVESDIIPIAEIMNSMKPTSYSKDNNEIEKIKEAIFTQIKELDDLSIKINYSILAYNACDTSLKQDIDKHLVDSLFDCFNPYLVKEMESILYENVHYKDYCKNNILVYNNDANLNILEERYKELIALDKDITDKAETIKDKYNDVDSRISNMSEQDIKTDLYNILDRRGQEELDKIYYTIENICPTNYCCFNLTPVEQSNGYIYYDINGNVIGDYQINSDYILIPCKSNCENVDMYYEITQILPKDCTTIENFAYDIIKVEVINDLLAQPSYIRDSMYQKQNVIVLTCDPKTQNVDFDLAYSGKFGNMYNASNLTVINVDGVMNEIMSPEYKNNGNRLLLELTTENLAYNCVRWLFRIDDFKLSRDELENYYKIFANATREYLLYDGNNFNEYIMKKDYSSLVNFSDSRSLNLHIIGCLNKSELGECENCLRYSYIVENPSPVNSVPKPGFNKRR